MTTIRNRIINFRVSEEEFTRLKAASTLQRARCLSDFARSAILRVACIAEPLSAPEPQPIELRSLERRLAVLESNIAQLVTALSKSESPSRIET